MRLAVFSDVHGNFNALRAVLNDVDKHAPFDHIVCAGDLCLEGSDSDRCLELLQTREIECVYGNTDQYIFNPSALPDEQHARVWDDIQRKADKVRSQIGDTGIAYLRNLPFELRYHPVSHHDDRDSLLVVHANPQDVHSILYPTPERQLELYDEVRQADDDPQLDAILSNVQAAVIAYGHLHTSFIRPWRHLTLVDVSPISMQVIDNDERARYSILNWQDGKWLIEQRFVEYE